MRALASFAAPGRHLIRADALRRDAWMSEAMQAHLTLSEIEILDVAADLIERLSDTPECIGNR